MPSFILSFSIQRQTLANIQNWFERHASALIIFVLTAVSVFSFVYYYLNGLGLAYNDARSHLDIGRRVVEGLKPGLAQLGSVWLPLPHVLMIPTIWSDFMWHSGLSGSIVSMLSFVVTGYLVFLFLKKIEVGLFGRIFGVFVFMANTNILYLQSTAMTELLLLATMTAGVYYLTSWFKDEKILDIIKASFFIMLSTLVRYDGWFLLFVASVLVGTYTLVKKGFKVFEGTLIFFLTLGGVGIALWFLWNLIIFKDPFYFVFGPFSARYQQLQLESAGNLPTKGNIFLSFQIYLYALFYNSYTLIPILGLVGVVLLLLDKKVKGSVRLACIALLAPLVFNVLALVLGHSVLFIQGISGNTWFNVRYGSMLAPSIAIFMGYLVQRLKSLRIVIVGLTSFVLFFAFANFDAVTIDDARVGSSQKNVSEVSDWLKENTIGKQGFILISAASHDAIIFSSGLSMKRFIHEGTGAYWESGLASPDRWARWIVMRSHDDNDLVWKSVSRNSGFEKYRLVESYPFADIYELDEAFLSTLNTKPVFGKQK